MHSRSQTLFAILTLALASLLADTAHALDVTRTLKQLRHTAWTARDGAPTEVSSITQTPDGFLWFAASSGLFRFDGLAFERIDPVPGETDAHRSVFGLYVSRDGALWMGLGDGTIVRRDARGTRVYGREHGLGFGGVIGFAETADGRLWAAAFKGALRLDGERWTPVGAEMGYPVGAGANFGKDGAGGLLAVDQTQGTWYSLGAHADRFVRRPELDGSADVARAPDGTVWTWDSQRRLRRSDDPRGERAFPIDFPAGSLDFDRDGALWVATYGDGLHRLACQDASRPAHGAGCAWERMVQGDGLSGSRVMSRFEDAQGNLWFGTTGGVDRFSDTRVVLAPYERNPETGALAPLPDGAVLAATIGHPPTRLDAAGGVQPLSGDFKPTDQVFSSAFRDDDGSIWFGGFPDLWHVVGGRVSRVAPPAAVTRDAKAQAIGRDARGDLWVAFRSAGMYRWDGRTWTSAPLPAADGYVNAFLRDAGGRLWMATSAGHVVRRDADGDHVFAAAQGLDLGEALSLSARSDHVLVGGSSGVALLRGDRFVALRLDDATSPSHVSGLVETADGELWLNDASGLLHVAAADYARFLADPGQPVAFERLDWRDGFYGHPPAILPAPSAIEAADGRLWFSRESAIFWIDPHRRYAQSPRSGVLITSASAQDTGAFTPGTALRPRTSSVDFSFTAFDLATPERTRFRQRLVGLDDDWHDLGSRRSTTFSHLPPGAYRFEVQAFDPGRWTSATQSFAFSVRPAWYQTLAWRAVVAVLALLALRALWRWRTAAVVRRLNERSEARLSERVRIARELHDTLLQGTQGLVFGFQLIAGEMPGDDDRRRRMESLLDRADGVIGQARDRVHGLRDLEIGDADLAQALARAGRDLATGTTITFDVHADADLLPLKPEVRSEVFLAMREALSNAFRHADARTVVVELQRRGRLFTCRVRDDGVGIDPDVLARGGRPGHWGLKGIQERARHVGGAAVFERADGRGTEVRIEIPGALAFARAPGRLRAALARWGKRRDDPGSA